MIVATKADILKALPVMFVERFQMYFVLNKVENRIAPSG